MVALHRRPARRGLHRAGRRRRRRGRGVATVAGNSGRPARRGCHPRHRVGCARHHSPPADRGRCGAHACGGRRYRHRSPATSHHHSCHMRLPGTTPAAPDDDGAADPRLLAALSADDAAQISVTMLSVRLLVPVVALPVDGGDAEMAVPALVAADGRRALPVFSSYDALRAWRADARPVPMPGARVVAGAVAEHYDGVVLDVAGPVPHTISGADLHALADAAAALLANPGVRISPID